MSLHAKVKTALDEARTLILGAQILLGFQFQAPFRDKFDTLPRSGQMLEAFALVLLVVTVGLLITPSSYQRIVDGGRSSGRMQFLTGRLAACALPPFAISLGVDLAVTLGRTWESYVVGAACGAAFTALAALGWFGAGWAMRRKEGGIEREKAEQEQGQSERAPLHARLEQMLTEARVILPGAQALLGFQLAIVMTSAFEKLPPSSRLLHGGALLCVALAVIMLMTPASLHRIVWAGEDSEAAVRVGGRLVILALVPLGLGLAGDSYVVLARVTESATLGAATAIALLLCLAALWFAWPLMRRAQVRPQTRP